MVRLADVGHARIEAQDERRVVRFNGETAIALGIIKRATANPLDVARATYEAMPVIGASRNLKTIRH